MRGGPGRDFVYLYLDETEPSEGNGPIMGAEDRIFCGHGEDSVWLGGFAMDPADHIHESCEEGNVRTGVSRQEFVHMANRGLRGGA